MTISIPLTCSRHTVFWEMHPSRPKLPWNHVLKLPSPVALPLFSSSQRFRTRVSVSSLHSFPEPCTGLACCISKGQGLPEETLHRCPRSGSVFLTVSLPVSINVPAPTRSFVQLGPCVTWAFESHHPGAEEPLCYWFIAEPSESEKKKNTEARSMQIRVCNEPTSLYTIGFLFFYAKILSLNGIIIDSHRLWPQHTQILPPPPKNFLFG